MENKQDRKKQAEDLLISALEGGSNYWYNLPDMSMIDTSAPNTPPSVDLFNGVWDKEAEVPVNDIETNEQLGTITKEKMLQAFETMHNDFPVHYGNLISENWDAETADVWFQLVVMNDVVFG